MGEVRSDLQAYLNGKPIRARAMGRPERMVRWCRRNPLLAGLSGVLGIAALAVLGLVWALHDRNVATFPILGGGGASDVADRYVQAGMTDTQMPPFAPARDSTRRPRRAAPGPALASKP
jgi:hypothetical protein